jgi:hypothetical protein
MSLIELYIIIIIVIIIIQRFSVVHRRFSSVIYCAVVLNMGLLPLGSRDNISVEDVTIFKNHKT